MAALVLAAGITMAPLAWLVRLAVRPGPGTSIWATLSANVATVWDQGFGGAFANSLWMAAAAAAATALLSLPAAFALATSRSRSLQGVAAALLALGLFQPIAVLIIPLFRVVLWLGLMDTPAGVVAPQVARVLPVAILLLWIGIRSLPGSILEAASIDGAAPRQTMVTVVVPLLWPLLVVILVWSFLVSWNDYLLPTVVIQDEGFQTIPLALAHFVGRFDTEYALLATGALVALAPVLAIYAGLYQVLARGMRRLGSLA
jgi:ABC-type glycerol-3-phosphate transport system permease component